MKFSNKNNKGEKSQERKMDATSGEQDAFSEESENIPEEMESEEEESAKAELKELEEKYLRLVAEFDNYRKRTAKEHNDLINRAGESVIKSLLDVMDDADRAEEQFEKSKDMAALKEGVDLIFNKLGNILKSKGLKKMKSRGEEFNPELHDAITNIPASSEEESGKVMDVVQEGYYLNDRIIRHAKVIVGK